MNFSKNKVFILLGLLIVNLLGLFIFYRWDLTEEKRYSLSDATINLVEGLEDQVVVKVYLEGESLPGGFDRLKRAIKENLEELKYYGGSKIDFQFIDPNAITDEKKRNEFFNELIGKGMQPTNIMDKEGGKRTENLVFPYATVWFQNKETTVQLLKANEGESAQNKLNQSYENIEYQLASAIRKVSLSQKKRIGLLTEFTKLPPDNFAGLISGLQEYYELYIVDAKSSPTFLGLDALIVPKPDRPVDDSTKYKIDQFVMSGGKALFFVDGLKVDSIGLNGTFAQPLKHNLEDLFFKYGVRINTDIVKDGLNCAVLPMVVGNMGDRPNIQPLPYRYFPLINNFGTSLITKNIDMVYTKFASSMDTVNSKGIKKTPLLLTSPYTKILNAPAFVTYTDARTETEEKDYQSGVKSIAYLLEGKFSSLYKNRFMSGTPVTKFIADSKETKIIICADGDVIVNDINKKNGEAMGLGFDKFTQHTFGNKDFVMNALDYLVDENGIIASRGKEIKLRPLDEVKTREQRSKWQLINTILPLLLLGFFGFVRHLFIKSKYAKS
jgi:ABC-2 type transport system permease protein